MSSGFVSRALRGGIPHQLKAVSVHDVAISLAAIALVTLLAQWVWHQYRLSHIPVFNKADPRNLNKTKDNFLWNAQKLLVDGFVKFPKSYLMQTDTHRELILSPDYANEIRSDERLSFEQHLEREFLGHIPGFDTFRPDALPDHMGVEMVRVKLTQSLGKVTEDLSEEMAAVLHEQWTENPEWCDLKVKDAILEIVARISSRVFLGPEICRNPDWLRITIDYTVNIFVAVATVKKYPKPLWPIVHWFLPECRKIRTMWKEARRIIEPVIAKRAAENWTQKESDPSRMYSDAIQWMHETARGRPYDPVVAQLALSVAAIHTTTDLLTQVIYDLCQHPDLIQPLRQEAIAALKDDGWKRTTLYKLKLMDSVIKESQRLKPAGMITMRRYATQNVTLKDGLFIPKGTMLGISSHWHWDSSIHPDADVFDGYRYVKMAQDPAKEKFSHFVTTSPESLGFGHGKHACPGRFFASNEIKIALVHLLLKYDWKLKEGSDPKIFTLGWMMTSDANATILVKRRREEMTL